MISKSDTIQTIEFCRANDAANYLIKPNSIVQNLAQTDALENCIIKCEKPSYPGSSRGEARELEPESKQGLRSKVSADGAMRDCRGREKSSDIEWHIGRVYCITGGEGREEVEVA